MTDTDALWGGTLTDLQVDVLRRSVNLVVRTMDDGRDTDYDVRLSEVTDLRVQRPDPNQWDYVEVTEVHVRSALTGQLVELLFWDEPNGLTATCEGVQVIERPRS
jgi:hypothetical protein